MQRERSYIVHVLPELAGMLSGGRLIPWQVRNAVLRGAGAKIHRTVEIRRGASGFGPNVHVGRETFIHRELMIQGSGDVKIGEFVAIGPRCILTTVAHEYEDYRRRGGPITTQPIAIEDGCWLGAGVIVLGGAAIGRGCVIAAGAVVNRDCTPHGLYAGVPARRVKDLPI